MHKNEIPVVVEDGGICSMPSLQNDLGLRIPGPEDTMMKMRMGQLNSSTSLHTFIRYVRDSSGGFFPTT